MRRAMALATPKTDAGPATSSSPQPSKANKAILRAFVIGKKKHIIVISARAKFGYSRRSFPASKTLEPSDGFDRCGVRQCCSTALGAVHEGNVPDQQRGGHLEKFFSPSRCESDSLIAMDHGRMERASHGADGLFRY